MICKRLASITVMAGTLFSSGVPLRKLATSGRFTWQCMSTVLTFVPATSTGLCLGRGLSFCGKAGGLLAAALPNRNDPVGRHDPADAQAIVFRNSLRFLMGVLTRMRERKMPNVPALSPGALVHG